MKARWLKRKENDVVERFYPITHIDAVVMDDDTEFKSLKDVTLAVKAVANPTYQTYTLVSSGWVGNSAPYRYTLTGFDGKTVEVLENVTMSMEQLEAIESAKIKSNPTESANILYAFGDKPTINVPVILAIRG